MARWGSRTRPRARRHRGRPPPPPPRSLLPPGASPGEGRLLPAGRRGTGGGSGSIAGLRTEDGHEGLHRPAARTPDPPGRTSTRLAAPRRLPSLTGGGGGGPCCVTAGHIISGSSKDTEPLRATRRARPAGRQAALLTLHAIRSGSASAASLLLDAAATTAFMQAKPSPLENSTGRGGAGPGGEAPLLTPLPPPPPWHSVESPDGRPGWLALGPRSGGGGLLFCPFPSLSAGEGSKRAGLEFNIGGKGREETGPGKGACCCWVRREDQPTPTGLPPRPFYPLLRLYSAGASAVQPTRADGQTDPSE